jgi:hypothetical protein
VNISGLPFGLAFLIWAVTVALTITAIAIVVLALRRWSYAAELQAQALDRLASAIERGALEPDARRPADGRMPPAPAVSP